MKSSKQNNIMQAWELASMLEMSEMEMRVLANDGLATFTQMRSQTGGKSDHFLV
jgi:hypothetical protein